MKVILSDLRKNKVVESCQGARILDEITLENYQKIIELAKKGD